MYESESFFALAREGSKGVPGKDVALVGGRLLVGWSTEGANRGGHGDRVIVRTDGLEFAEVASRCGTVVPYVRLADLPTDASPTSAAVRHTIGWLEGAGEGFDVLVVLRSAEDTTLPWRPV